jgi:hypothetical protein
VTEPRVNASDRDIMKYMHGKSLLCSSSQLYCTEIHLAARRGGHCSTVRCAATFRARHADVPDDSAGASDRDLQLPGLRRKRGALGVVPYQLEERRPLPDTGCAQECVSAGHQGAILQGEFVFVQTFKEGWQALRTGTPACSTALEEVASRCEFGLRRGRQKVPGGQ